MKPTSFPEIPATLARAHIVSVIDGGAFALIHPDQGKAFVSGAAVEKTGISAGDTVDAFIVPNAREPEKTPWFARSILPEINPSITAQAALDLLRDCGGSWTPEQVAATLLDRDEEADVTASEVEAALAVLEFLYRGRVGISKVVLFRQSGSSGDRVWYTLTPDTCDYAEFDE